MGNNAHKAGLKRLTLKITMEIFLVKHRPAIFLDGIKIINSCYF